MINKQKSDVIFFTGDMVNNKAEEMIPWAELFSSLSAVDGKYSILGNHDYGDYVTWNTEEEKMKKFFSLLPSDDEDGNWTNLDEDQE